MNGGVPCEIEESRWITVSLVFAVPTGKRTGVNKAVE